MKNPNDNSNVPLQNPYLSSEKDKSDFNDGFEQFTAEEEVMENVAESSSQQENQISQEKSDEPNPQSENYQNAVPNPQSENYQGATSNLPYSYGNVQNQNPYNRNYTENPYYKQYHNYGTPNATSVSSTNPSVMNGNIPRTYYHNPAPYVLKREFDRTDRIFAALTIFVGLFFVWFIIVQEFNMGIGATVSFTTALFLSYAYVSKKDMKIDGLHKVTFFMMAFLCIPFTLYNNRMALAMDFVTLLFGTLYWVYSANGKERKSSGNYFSDFFVGCFAYPLMNYGAMFPAIFRKNDGKKNGNIKWIILGLIIAIPFVGIVSALLMESDEMFEIMFSFIFDNFLSRVLEYVLYTIFGLPIAMAFFSAWYTKYIEDKKYSLMPKSQTVQKTNRYVVPLALVYSVIIPVCVVYFLYLISQVSYFISFIADNLLPKDFTIVDYARRGFFELCVIAVINLAVIILMVSFSKRPQGKTAVGVKAITIIMSAFTMIFIVTAIYKMSMYIKKYGYTPMRIDTAVFMIFLFVIFVTIILHQIFGKINLFKTTTVILLLFLGVFNVMNVDAFVAKENIRMYKNGQIEWMGTDLLYRLDDSAYEYIVPFAEEENNGLTKEDNKALHSAIRSRKTQLKYSSGYEDMSEAFPSFNVSRYKVCKILNRYDEEKYEKMYRDNYYNDDYYNDDYYHYNEGV